jgi:hypothetical protein
MGVFVSLESIRLLLDDRKLTAAIARSEARQARKPGRTARGTAVAGVPSRSSVTATRATSRKRSATPVDLD